MNIDDVPQGAGTDRPQAPGNGHPPGTESGLDPGPAAGEFTTNTADPDTDPGNAALATALAQLEGGRRRFPDGQRRIFLAAIDAFSERGFHATTTRDIAARAGLSPAGLYVHFRSKEEVLHRISLSALRLTQQVAEAAATGPGSTAERLAATVRALTIWHARYSGSVRVVLYHLTDLTPDHRAEVTEVQHSLHRLIRDLAAEGADAGDFDITDPSATALALLALSVDASRWYRPAYRSTPETLGDEYATLALRMVGARTS
ncbi:TetR/AcrR family transcriptional regulator [Nocardia sp. NPDC005978]|uniref:TetR/AcrR family transcriptional regulator n=1 Tax=Nocardia sp. NPDC005978 TaxID=3156725 RepID=UPI0033AE0A19